MKIVVDNDLCEGNARCMRAAPALFHVGPDDDRATVLIAEPGPELQADARKAAALCPRQAITLIEE